MIGRKKAKKRAKPKKKATGSVANSKKPVDAVQMREQVARAVAKRLGCMTSAVIEEAEKGDLPEYKYLLEVAGVHPLSPEKAAEKADSDDLAQVLLNSFEFPKRLPKNEGDAENAESTVPAGVGNDSVE